MHAYNLTDNVRFWSIPGDLVATGRVEERLAVGHFVGRVTVIDAQHGTVVWGDDDPQGVHFRPVAGDDIVTVVDDRNIAHVYELARGDKIASVPLPETVPLGPSAVTSEVVALPTRDGLFAVSRSGEEVITFAPGREGHNQMSGVAVVDDKVIVTGSPGLYLLVTAADPRTEE